MYDSTGALLAPARKGRPLTDLTGKVFTRLTVLRRVEGKSPRHPVWLCSCSCGNDKVIAGAGLTSGNSKSCGCLNHEQLVKNHTTHGMCRTPEYQSWSGMWKRCTDPKDKRYHLYKDRTPPEDWKDFTVFFAHVGLRPTVKHSLERIDNDKPYGPGNVTWATATEQSNNRTNNHKVTYKDRTQTIAQWSREFGMSQYVLYARLFKLGWSVERAMTEPVRPIAPDKVPVSD